MAEDGILLLNIKVFRSRIAKNYVMTTRAVAHMNIHLVILDAKLTLVSYPMPMDAPPPHVLSREVTPLRDLRSKMTHRVD